MEIAQVYHKSYQKYKSIISVLFILTFLIFPSVNSQNFDFDKLYQKVKTSSVIIEMDIEFSFGVHNNVQKSRFLGTIVTEEGLVIFNGTTIGGSHSIPLLAGLNVKATPDNISLTTFDDKTYQGEYIGFDQITKIAFIKITNLEDIKFTPMKFHSNNDYVVGNWVALYTLLPEYISPSLAADVGLISSIIEKPEFFPLIMGFSSSQLTSVIFDKDYEPIGVLGRLAEEASADLDPSAFLESGSRFTIPLLGVISSERLRKLIENPPEKGKTEQGWLGISMQALTEEIAGYWSLDLDGGIIVNDVMNLSPALQAGLAIGDIIYEVNGEAVEVDRDENMIIFQRIISELGPDTPVELSIIRLENQVPDSLKILVTLEAAPISPVDAPEYEIEALEFKIRELVFLDYFSRNLDEETFSGVVVSELNQGGVAEVEGLQIGDVIQRIGSNDITSVDEFQQIIEEVITEQPFEIIFFVWRNNKTLFVNVKTDWQQDN